MNNKTDNDSWTNTLFRSAIICVAMVAGLGIFNRGSMVLIPYAAVLATLTVLRKREYLCALAVSTALGLSWVYAARDMYAYSGGALVLGGINMFTLTAFSLGLPGVYLIYSQFQKKLRLVSFRQKLTQYCSIYWVLLIAFEWVGYHVFNIRNAATASYPGLYLLNCLHAPPFMQLAYFSFGPVFFATFYFLSVKLENRHRTSGKYGPDLFSPRKA